MTIAKYNKYPIVTPNKNTNILWDISKFHKDATIISAVMAQKMMVMVCFILAFKEFKHGVKVPNSWVG